MPWLVRWYSHLNRSYKAAYMFGKHYSHIFRRAIFFRIPYTCKSVAMTREPPDDYKILADSNCLVRFRDQGSFQGISSSRNLQNISRAAFNSTTCVLQTLRSSARRRSSLCNAQGRTALSGCRSLKGSNRRSCFGILKGGPQNHTLRARGHKALLRAFRCTQGLSNFDKGYSGLTLTACF